MICISSRRRRNSFFVGLVISLPSKISGRQWVQSDAIQCVPVLSSHSRIHPQPPRSYPYLSETDIVYRMKQTGANSKIFFRFRTSSNGVIPHLLTLMHNNVRGDLHIRRHCFPPPCLLRGSAHKIGSPLANQSDRASTLLALNAALRIKFWQGAEQTQCIWVSSKIKMCSTVPSLQFRRHKPRQRNRRCWQQHQGHVIKTTDVRAVL